MHHCFCECVCRGDGESGGVDKQGVEQGRSNMPHNCCRKVWGGDQNKSKFELSLFLLSRVSLSKDKSSCNLFSIRNDERAYNYFF